MIQMIGLVLIAVLAENLVLIRPIGMGWPKNTISSEKDAWRMGCSLTLVMTVTALTTWVLNTFVLRYFALEYLRVLVYALVALGVIRLLRLLLERVFPTLSRQVDECLSETVYNCAVLGVALIVTLRNYNLLQSVLYAFFGGVGVLLVLVIFAGLQDQASFDKCPKVFRGLPIQLITAGLMALALMGFAGLNVQ